MMKKLVRLADFLANPLRDTEIFGMFGHPGNLGDEAMLVAAKQVLGRRALPWQSYRVPLLNALVKRKRHGNLLVAGGTLIHGGKTGWLDYVEHRSNQGARVVFFGTGMAFTEDQIRQPSDSFRRWARILQKSGHVHLRGPRSVALAGQMGTKADIFGDFALLLYDPAIPVADPDTRQDVIGLNLGLCLGDQAGFEDSAATLVRSLKGRHRLIFHAVVEDDVPVTLRVAEAAGLSPADLDLRRHFRDPIAFMQDVRTYRAFFGLKLHAAGLAMVAGVPNLMVAYRPKAYDFMEGIDAAPDFRGRDLLIDLPMDPDLVIDRVKALLARPDDFILTDQIAALAARQRAQLTAAFAD